MKKIVLTGGGTLGHVSPALALVPNLIEKGYDIHYIGSRSELEKNATKGFDLRFYPISTGKLRRYFSLQNMLDPFKVIWGLMQSIFLLIKIKPDVVFSKGGYVSVPVVLAAKLLRIPIISHESDLTPGLATKMALRFADKICCNFKECADLIGSKGVHSGIPLREELSRGDISEGLKMTGFTGEKPIVLFMGGSQGAVVINESLRKALPLITTKYDVLHICGKGNLSEEHKNIKAYYQVEFLSDKLKDALCVAEIVVSRAGANAITELLSLQKPMLLIPLAKNASRGDQILNAENYQKNGFAHVLLQEDMNENSLSSAIDKLYEDRDNIKAAQGAKPPLKGEIILELIEKAASKKRR